MKSGFPSYFSFSVLLLLLISACADGGDQSEKLLGEWYNESLEVKLDASHGGDSIFDVPPGKWEEILKIKPILTSYTVDGKYNSKYVNLEGVQVREAGGTWELVGDTLFLTESGVRTGYHVQWMEGKAAFSGYLDWDSDGEEDDLYRGVQIKK